MNEPERNLLWLRLSQAEGVGRILLKRLFDHFGSAEKIFEADEKELGRVEGIKRGIRKEFNKKDHQEFAEQELEQCAKLGVSLVGMDSPLYPKNLLQIPDPPPVLYCRGGLKAEDSRAVAVVGSRNHDDYGEVMARRMGAGLAKLGITVVSGMARGIDSLSQGAALDAGGRTLAVLGCGVDRIYPPELKNLYDRIAEAGAVLSEFPLGTGPKAENFPQRNRIISGLSAGVVVVQANNPRSGALITARLALDQGRPLYAVPGNALTPWARETNSLIKQGALLAEGAEDVVLDLFPSLGIKKDELGPLFLAAGKTGDLTKAQDKFYSLLPDPEEGAAELDSLIRKSGLSAGEAQALLTELELFGLIEKRAGGKWRKKPIAQ